MVGGTGFEPVIRFPKHIPLFSTLSQLESTSGLNLWDDAGAIGILFAVDAQGIQLGEPEVGEWGASLAVNVRTEP